MHKRLWRYCFFTTLLAALIYLSLSLHGGHINPDGMLYFSYLRSAFFDHDLLFTNEFNTLGVLPNSRYVTRTGLEGNHVAIGSPLLVAPFYGLAVVVTRLLSQWGIVVDTQGFYDAYTLAFPTAALCYLLLTLWLWIHLLPENVRRSTVLMSILGMLFGTPLFFYAFIAYEFSHIYSAFSVSLLMTWVMIKYVPLQKGEGNYSFRIDYITGMLAALATMVRTQNSMFFIFPLWFIFSAEYKKFKMQTVNIRYFTTRLCFRFIWSMLAFAITFSPQAAVWKVLNGSWLRAPEAANLNWAHAHLWNTMFSSYHGIIPWTPFIGLCLAGFVLMLARLQTRELGTLFLLLWSCQWVINSSIFAWWEAASFGMRLFLNCSFILFLGSIAFLQMEKVRGALFAVIIVCILWTQALFINAFLHRIDLNFYEPADKLIATQLSLPMALFRRLENAYNTLHTLYPLKALAVVVTVMLLFLTGLGLKNRVCVLVKHIPQWKWNIGSSALLLCIPLALTFFILNMEKITHLNQTKYHHQLNVISASSDDYRDYMMSSYLVFHAAYLKARGKLGEAIVELEKALRLPHRSPEMYIDLVRLYMMTNQLDKAHILAQRGAANYPQNVKLKNLLTITEPL